MGRQVALAVLRCSLVPLSAAFRIDPNTVAWPDDAGSLPRNRAIIRPWFSESGTVGLHRTMRTLMSPCSKRRFSLASAPGRSRPELLLRDHAGEVEFITIMRFDDIPPVRAFAGADYEAAVVPAAAQT